MNLLVIEEHCQKHSLGLKDRVGVTDFEATFYVGLPWKNMS